MPARSPDAPATVRVACRLNNGLLLRTFERVIDADTGMQVFKETFRGALRGTRAAVDSCVETHPPAVTEDVPRVEWERWLADNQDQSYVRDRLVYALED